MMIVILSKSLTNNYKIHYHDYSIISIVRGDNICVYISSIKRINISQK
jgi:hypothetical protein